jgi:carboxyl-terminal processing protease
MTDISPRSRRPSVGPLLLLAVFFVGILVGRSEWFPGSASREPRRLRETFAPYWEAWHLVEKAYVDRAAVQPQRMMQGSIDGMLDSLGDEGHTSYLTPEEVKRLEENLKGQMEGIGARVSLRKGRPTIVQTLPNSPARTAGLKAGDVMEAVDSKPTTGLSLQRVVEQVRGPAGTSVRLTILRDGKTLEISVPRGQVRVPEVSWQMVAGAPVVHVALLEFGKSADAELKKALEEARKRGARGLILDVRGNPGGLKEQAVAVTSEFLQSGDVFIQVNAAGKRDSVPVQPGGVATDLPMVCLIDQGTASSAEILAGALQDHHRAKLVGMRTFGTGTVLGEFHLSDGSAVLLAIAEWLTPDGRKIWHKGISPDVEVSLPDGAAIELPDGESGAKEEDLAQSEDKQILKALEILKGELK